MAGKVLTVRLPQDIYEGSRALAEKQHISLNTLIRNSLRASIAKEEEKALYDAFSLVAEDKDEASVEFVTHAQSEVIADELH